MDVPREHWAQIASTNPIERLGGTLMLEQNDAWAVCRRYRTWEGLKPVSDDPPIELPVVAA